MRSDHSNVDHRPLSDREKLLRPLTASQREAVQHVDGPQLILAGPGSGKTRVVTHRIAYMLMQGIPEDRIVALTFTNKAAQEMQHRLDSLCPGRRVWIGTFHRLCAQLLRRHASLVGLHENYSIYDTDDSLKLLHEAMEDADVELIFEKPSRIASAISWAKNDLITADDYRAPPNSAIGTLVEQIYPHYQRRLLEANAVDFDDLLLHVAMLLRSNTELRESLDERFRYIMVDEYQDTNLAQYAIVRALSVQHPNLSVTGDPDQSIYGWRGASIHNILDFERDFSRVHVVRLEQNFRSSRSIVRAADQLITNNLNRKEKALRTDNPQGKPVRIAVYSTGREEADVIAARIANEVSAQQRRCRDYAIFYRTNALSRTLERSFRAIGVPYQIVRGLEFYQRKEVKDVLAYLQLLNNPANDVALLRVINTPPRRIGKTTVDRIRQYAQQNRLPLLEAARRAGLIESLSQRTAVTVAKFVALLDSMHPTGGETVEEVLRKTLSASGYREWLASPGSEQERQRLDNVDELLSDAREFDESHPDEGGLEAFLEQASLVADIDDWETETDCVTMMTLHAAKGLEFPVVFIIAVEEDMLPHRGRADHCNEIEEERRLLFVGMTRAKEELHLSAAQERTVRGRADYQAPSPFLMELPRGEMEVLGRLDYTPQSPVDCDAVDDWDHYVQDGDVGVLGDVESPEDEEGPFTSKRKQKRSQRKVRRRADGDVQATSPSAPIVTAADLAGSTTDETEHPPDVFRQGMVVLHPKYGIGRIVALGGTGAKRSASVRFTGEVTPRSFRLAYSPLRPVGN